MAMAAGGTQAAKDAHTAFDVTASPKQSGAPGLAPGESVWGTPHHDDLTEVALVNSATGVGGHAH